MRIIDGPSPGAVEVYRAMLRHPEWDAAQVSGHLGVDDDALREARRELAAWGLVRESEADPGVPRAVHPDIAMTDLQERQRNLDAARTAVTSLAIDLAVPGTGTARLRGADAVRDRTRCLVNDAAEVALCARGRASELVDEWLLVGRRLRAIYRTAHRDHLADHQRVLGPGARTRTVDDLPWDLVLCPDAAVVASGQGEALVVSAPEIVAALRLLFDHLWDGAAAPAGDAELTDLEREVLALVASGATDETAGSRLGLSARSVRRVVAGLMDRLGARSRFQAGRLAVGRGWLNG